MSTVTLPNSAALPLAPTPQLGASGHRAHSVQFYADSAFFLDEVSSYIGAALLAGDAAVVIATVAHRDGLVRRLQSRGLDTTRAIEEGRYIALDAADTLASFMLDRSPDAALFTETLGAVLTEAAAAACGKSPHIAAFGEMVALLWEQGNTEGAIQLEQLWNNLTSLYPMSLRCGYPISGFHRGDHADSFLRICGEHSHVIPAESYSTTSSDEQRLRSVSYLQQKAQALETEMAERKQVEEALRRTQAQLESMVEQRTSALRQLSSRLLSLQDTERRRIARELHDSLGQYLVGLKLNMEMLKQSPENQESWSEADHLMQQCMAEVRTLSYLLHPPTMDAAGFASAARWFVEGFSQRSGVQTTLDVPEHLGRLPDAVELALFRVLQESLTNVHRHSGASEAQVLIAEDAGQVVLEIKDNGRGIPEELLTSFHATGAGMGVGLAGIRERAWELGGTLAVNSDSSGTVVRVALPVPRNTRD
ncbi:MAG: ATP-binding protein [Terriglobales bacterium]|jgi:signal transduction histidine kinase